MMANLLEETKEILSKHGKELRDIIWCGSNKNYVDVDKFIELADTRYDDGYGAPEVAENLLVVGNNWWLERHEYDGSEWWEYKECPQKPTNKIDLKALTIYQANKCGFDITCGWETLERINGVDKE